jgi:AcrR family transcriptional regulator
MSQKKELEPRVRRDAENTVEKVVDVATRLFAEKGYDGVSTKEICREAGVNVAAIHYHFESKENLYLAVMERFGGAAFDAAIRTLQPVKTIEEFRTRLTIHLSEVLETIARQPELARTIARDSQIHVELMHTMMQKTFGRAEEAMIRFIDSAREANVLNPDLSTKVCVMAIQSNLYLVISGHQGLKLKHGFDLGDPVHRQSWVEKTVELYLNGVRAR